MTPLSAQERSWLLAHARTAIARRLGLPSEPIASPSAGCERASGAFVTLHLGGELRGCIGTLDPDRPLRDAVAEMAVAAAFHDPRFPPLGIHELSDLEIEISVLSPLADAHPDDVIVGVHGVAIASGGRRAVYLPSVATEAGWDRRRLLEETCLKARLPPDCWRDPSSRLSVFTAEVFGDPREGA